MSSPRDASVPQVAPQTVAAVKRKERSAQRVVSVPTAALILTPAAMNSMRLPLRKNIPT